MATAAFKSTSKRTPTGKSSPSTGESFSSSASVPSNKKGTAHRRSRSLSRFSHQLSGGYGDEDLGKTPTPPTRGKFVNTVRGSGLPDAALDDIARTLFDSALRSRGRSGSRADAFDKGNSSLRRGRSISRHENHDSTVRGNACTGERVGPGRNTPQRRSVSVVRYRMSDSESDRDNFPIPNNHSSLRNSAIGFVASEKTGHSNTRQGLRRSLSHLDLKHHDGYSSQSSGLTDEEIKEPYSNRNGTERTKSSIYAQKIDRLTSEEMDYGLYEVMRKEIRSAVDEIRMELEHATLSKRGGVTNESVDSRYSNFARVVSSTQSSYVKNLDELPTKQGKDDHRRRELSKPNKEMPTRGKKRSNDRSRMSMRLSEEAEKYIEDFLSNIEDTDISSIDGERSETSSNLGCVPKNESYQTPSQAKPSPVEEDGIVLPWLQWETSNDLSPPSCSSKTQPPSVPKINQPVELQGGISESVSSQGSWSPAVAIPQSTLTVSGSSFIFRDPKDFERQAKPIRTKSSGFDIDEYLNQTHREEFLLERCRQNNRICSGSLLLCGKLSFNF